MDRKASNLKGLAARGVVALRYTTDLERVRHTLRHDDP